MLYLITRSGVTNARMVFAVGSIFTRTEESALFVGTTFHLISGSIFGIIYSLAFMVASPMNATLVISAGAGLGFIHGLIVCFALIATVSEVHPLEEFRGVGIAVGVAHLIVHILYGLLVGVVIAASGLVAPDVPVV